jgi:hypothetical protein
MRAVVIVIAMLAAAVVAAVFAGAASWRRGTAKMIDGLALTVEPTPHGLLGYAFDQMPSPAARYLRRALGDRPRRIRSAIATQQARFFINGGWRSLTATQHFTTSPPGFVWDARIEMVPLVPASVRDAYVAGRGSLQASIHGLYSVADLAGMPQLNSGALQRFLGEAVWFPTALMPSPSVSWAPRDERSSTVTLTDGETRVALVFEFDGNDDVIRISGDRFKEINGSFVLQPWAIECTQHAERSGMRIPLYCEVAWVGANGPEPYWRGHIATIEYMYWQ